MKRISLILSTFLISLPLFVQGQINDSSVLLTLGKDQVTRGEFLRVYQKNSFAETKESDPKKALEDYLQLFINFRMKVQAAKDAGYDTMSDIQNELKTYRMQLAMPYLMDKHVSQDLLDEAYHFYSHDVRASHILINLSKNAEGKDTLEAYKKAMEARAKILKGEEFGLVAIEYSDDPSIKSPYFVTHPALAGELGYFTAFNMVYPFEKATYALNIGEISMPIRSNFGYHIIKLIDKQKALGRVSASHILISIKPDAKAEDIKTSEVLAQKIKDELNKGANFAELAKTYSEDKVSAENGGKISDFTVNRMDPNFVSALYGIKKGEIVGPVKSRFGFHIIKLNEYSGVPSFDELASELEYKISRDERSKLPKEAFVEKLKKQYKFSETKNVFKTILSLVGDSILEGTWKYEHTPAFDKKLFSYADTSVTYHDFAKFIEEKQIKFENGETKTLALRKLYTFYVEFCVMGYEDKLLENKYPEFKALLQEYKDGIYLFDITNRKVWGKASSDSLELEAFYNTHKDNYMWPAQAEAYIFKYDVNNLNSDKVKKFMEKAFKKGWDFDQIQINADKSFGKTNFTLEQSSFEKGMNPFIDKSEWKQGELQEILSGGTEKAFVYITRLIPSTHKSLDEIRGLLIADFQIYLEQEWIKELRKKYNIHVDQEVFRSMLP